MYIEEVINEALKDEIGLLNGMIINNVRFSADIALLASKNEDLQDE